VAKLSARGRREYLRARKGDQAVAYMSDGTVLAQERDPLTGRMGRWRHAGRWDHVATSLPILRAYVVSHGWRIVSGDGPRAGSLAAFARVVVPPGGASCR